MLLRKRAWDIMREDFAIVKESASLAEVIRVLRESMKTDVELRAVVVTGANSGRYKGTISVWTVLKQVEKAVFKDSEVKLSGETDWDNIFERAMTVYTQTGIEELIETDVAMLKPGDPLLVVMETFLGKKRRRYAIVEEGGRAIGMVLAADLFRELSRDLVNAM